MVDYKVHGVDENEGFVYTRSFRKIYRMFRSLKNRKGRFVLITGTPGTGKSANIYTALKSLDLNVYEPALFLHNVNMSYDDVFNEFFKTLRADLNVETNEEVYKKVQKYDVVLLADKILDSEFINKEKAGLSLWTLNKGLRALPFYFKIELERLKHKNELKNVNIVIQTVFAFRFNGRSYDILTDFSIFSKILIFILKHLFEIIMITYSEEEILQIVRNNFKHADDTSVKSYIEKYGHKPRSIFKALRNEGETIVPKYEKGFLYGLIITCIFLIYQIIMFFFDVATDFVGVI